MLKEKMLTEAVSRIRTRAERQTDIHKILESYVDSGIISQIQNQNHQILYGRRGTGKTHVLQILKSNLTTPKSIVTYIDCRTLGSTSQFADASLPLPKRCLALFRDILSSVYNELLEAVFVSSAPNQPKALEEADKLLAAIVEQEKIFIEREVSVERQQSDESSTKGDISISGKPSVGFESGDTEKRSQNEKRTFDVSTTDKILFPSIFGSLTRCLELLDTHLYILLDEWSSLPQELQPYLAEFLKRGVIPVNHATMKIAALEQRTVFTIKSESNHVGFELGADIAASQDLDDSYVYDRNPEQIVDVYAEILYRHILTEIEDKSLLGSLRINSGKELTSRMFTERATFQQLARAAEGVVRDLVCIFSDAYFHALQRQRDSIDREAISEASRKWFEQDKANNLDASMHIVLRRLVDEVIGKKKAKSFLVPRELGRHPMIQKLIDARVLHLVQRGYADKDNPGIRYNIYSLDYGTYIDLINTSKAPQVEMIERETNDDFIVPFDDKRSIRRIVLEERILDVSS